MAENDDVSTVFVTGGGQELADRGRSWKSARRTLDQRTSGWPGDAGICTCAASESEFHPKGELWHTRHSYAG